MMELFFVPGSEFKRLLSVEISPIDRASLFSLLCRINSLYMIRRGGSGHIGSSFSSLDIVSWLFLNELRLEGDDRDFFFSSKGHDVPGLYSVLIGLGLLEPSLLHQLRRKDGLPGHPDCHTPYIVTNTGSLGMGLSKAEGMILADRLSGKKSRYFVLTGDGELQEGQFWEALQSGAHRRLTELTVIVDHNKLQSDTWIESVISLGAIEEKFAAFGWKVARCSGHDFIAFSESLYELSQERALPKILIADTVKGRGVSFMEAASMKSGERYYRYHSGAPSPADYEKAFSELISEANVRLDRWKIPSLLLEKMTVDIPRRVTGERLVQAYAEALVEEGGKDNRIVVLDGDLAVDCGLVPFAQTFPERFIECGISEQDMVSQAGGLALKGFIPIVHSFASFLSMRPNEQIYNNATEGTKIIYVGSLAGILPAGPGHSHQAVRDVAALSSIPGLIQLEPATASEVKLALDFSLRGTDESCYLRLVSVPWNIPFVTPPRERWEMGRGYPLRDGADVAVIGYGPILLSETWLAAETLEKKEGISLKLINLPWLNRCDECWLAEELADFKLLFTLDNHFIHGGQGDLISHTLKRLSLPCDVIPIGIEGIPICGENREVLHAHHLSADKIAERIRKEMRSRRL